MSVAPAGMPGNIAVATVREDETIPRESSATIGAVRHNRLPMKEANKDMLAPLKAVLQKFRAPGLSPVPGAARNVTNERSNYRA